MSAYRLLGLMVFALGAIVTVLGPVLFFTGSSWVLLLWPFAGVWDMYCAKDCLRGEPF